MSIKHVTLLELALAVIAPMAAAQDVLPFPEPESASTVGKTLKDSKHQWRQAEKHLPLTFFNLYLYKERKL